MKEIWDEEDASGNNGGNKSKSDLESEYFVYDRFKDYNSVNLKVFDKDDLYEPNLNDREAIKTILKKINSKESGN